MRKRWKLLLAACALITCVVVATVDYRQPSTGGHRLSHWISLHAGGRGGPSSSADRERAADAIRQIGTNALPYLLRWMDYEPGQWRYKVSAITDKMPTWLQASRPMRWLMSDTHSGRAGRATEAFTALGPIAAPAIPELERRAFLTNSPAVRANAQLALAYLGPLAVPIMSRLLSAPDATGDLWLMVCVRELGTNALPLVPIYVHGLQATNPVTAMNSVRALGQIRLNPELTIPALSNCLTSPRRELRMEAPKALGVFDEAARPVVPALVAALQDSDPDVRRNAGYALQHIAPEIFTNTVSP